MTDATTSLVRVEAVTKTFRRSGSGLGGLRFTAVDQVDLHIDAGETLGLVGESGSGKSTVGRLAVGMHAPDAGEVYFDGAPVSALRGRSRRAFRESAAMVFQDPYSALDPRWTIARVVAEPLLVAGVRRSQRRDRAAEALSMVGLDASCLARRPREFSGGQRQRIAVARALVSQPRLVVCDESVSALDVSTQAQVLGLLRELQRELGLAYLFISHDLHAVRRVSHRVAVMYLGRIVESGSTEDVVGSPAHPYTAALVSAMPVADPTRIESHERIVLAGSPPSAADPPTGCAFRTRCPLAMPVCARDRPPLRPLGAGRAVACHLYDAPQPPSPAAMSSMMLDALSARRSPGATSQNQEENA